MPTDVLLLPEVYTTREIARAAGCRPADVQQLVDAGRIATVDGEFVAEDEARHALALLSGGEPALPAARRTLFVMPDGAPRDARVPLAASTAVHGALVGALALLPFLPMSDAAPLQVEPAEPVRLVFLATPGPGGGGGGGGLRQPRPPARAKRQGERRMSSPVPPAEPEAPVAPPPPDPLPPPEDPEPVQAPVASVPSDPETQDGVLEETTAEEANGPGDGGGAGTGEGTGLGEGQGSGLGEGSGGGTGGGPYRPGSGIEPPALLREVKPQYTEEARRRKVEGDVLLEIVVRHDGSVGDVRLLRGLGSGLDQRAIDAVRQWRFAPARRHGTPVDVLVEVAVEFKLR